ncbi:MAG: hypothetical protein Q9195_004741 [Heterodermia aff. obscurata]
MCSVCARYYIRVYVQKQFSSDDGILLFGVACLIVAIGLLLKLADEMYVVGSQESGNLIGVAVPSNFIDQAYYFQKMVTVALILTWLTIVSVKFSYLFLFRRLIGRMPKMMAYWWFVAGYNALISVYGAIVYGVECPYYYTLKDLQGIFGSGLTKSFAFSESQMVLDIIGDLLIIFIPFRLIWSVKLLWTQKIALASTLCLTIVTIMCTIVRIGGIHTGYTVRSIDSIWETYWQFVAANIALGMTAATAFRTFFVNRNADNQGQDQGEQVHVHKEKWYSKGWRFINSVFSTRLWHSWRSKGSRGSNEHDSGRDDTPMELRQQIPSATLTGMRTRIWKQAVSSSRDTSQMMHSVEEEEYQDDWPLSAVQGSSKYSV